MPCLTTILLVAGCGTTPAVTGGGSPSTAETEPNDTFSQARKAVLSGAKTATLTGSIADRDDLDVYDLGPLSPGDRLIIDVATGDSELDTSIAVFDADFNIFMNNDDEDLDAGALDPYIDEVIRHASASYYVAVGRSAFAGFGVDEGDYEVSVRVQAGTAVPEPKGQLLLLNFDGGEVESDDLLVKQVRPFSAEAISPVYAGQGEVMIEAIIDSVNENFEAFDVAVYTDAGDIPAGQEYSTIMLGSRSTVAFGIAESVDHYNSNHSEMAIIFTESFQPDRFTRTPSADELGLAIGNIAAHEAGHLLGLNHVDDETAIMDGASPADTFLADQDFKATVLSGDILPLGYQDAPLLLSESVGLLDGFSLPLARSVVRRDVPRLRKADASRWCGTCNPELGR